MKTLKDINKTLLFRKEILESIIEDFIKIKLNQNRINNNLFKNRLNLRLSADDIIGFWKILN